MTPKGQTRDPNNLRGQYLENGWRCDLATIAIDSQLWGRTVSDPGDSSASCYPWSCVHHNVYFCFASMPL